MKTVQPYRHNQCKNIINEFSEMVFLILIQLLDPFLILSIYQDRDDIRFLVAEVFKFVSKLDFEFM